MRILALLLMVAVISLIGATGVFAADPWVQFNETELAGSWLYQFTIVNPLSSGDAISDMVISISSPVINDGPTFITSGGDWNLFSSSPSEVSWISGTSVDAGTSLGGFSFTTSEKYTGNFAYTLGGGTGDFTGNASVVPEPGTMAASLALLSPACVSLMWRIRRRRSRTT